MNAGYEEIAASLADQYRLEGEVGAGGMATVYLAEDLKHRRWVAIKVLRPDVAASVGADRFLAEIRVTATFQHPHILPLFDSGEVNGVPYYVMPYVDSESLRDRLKRAGRMALEEALALAGDVASALTFAHASDVVHRDIKPENILIRDGEALVADFGIALAVARVGDERLTLTGASLGTPAYMSPEQIGGDDRLDGRADQYALAAILYEMLTGAPPFDGPTAQAIFARTLTEAVQPPSARGVSLPATVDAAIVRALSKRPEDRFASAREFIAACTPAAAPRPRSRWPLLAGGVAVLVAMASGIGYWRSQARAHAVALLPEIRAHADAGDYTAAYALAERVGGRLESDSVFQSLQARVSDAITVRTEPAGARVYLAAFGDTTIPDSADGTLIGTTPIEGHVVARGDHRLVIRAAGHHPVRRIATRYLAPTEGRSASDRNLGFDLQLPPEGSVPEGMEPVPGGPYEIVGHDVGRGQTVELGAFAIDRYEVSNEQFAAFVRAGGYRDGTLWPVADEALRGRFVDRTGLPSPRDWVNGEPPSGRAHHPVAGVSWPEASAYCAWRGGRLPSLFEWEKASRDGRASRIGVLMPWGQYDPRARGLTRANFSGSGTAPVDSYPFAISPYGVYNMAGNVKEWLANRVGEGWGTAGGSWQDPMYLFSQVGSQSSNGSPALGFRCVRPLDTRLATAGIGPLPVATVPRTYEPVRPEQFPALLAHYRYDARPANPRGRTVVEAADWIRERVWIDGPKNDSVLVYLYLPHSSRPPYQPIVYMPSSAVFGQLSVSQEVEDVAAGQIRAGRAIVAAVLAGMVEREGDVSGRPSPPTVEFRDLMVRHATELRLAMDYAATRSDIDTTRFAYVALSLGAGSRVGFAAVDPRFKSVVLLGAGIDERVQPTLPEAANFNFIPYIRAPKLVVNGRQDEEHPWQSRGKALWDLLSEPKELLLVEGAGHLVPVEVRTPRINTFLDQTLGPVLPRRQ